MFEVNRLGSAVQSDGSPSLLCRYCGKEQTEVDPEVCRRCGALIGTLRVTRRPELSYPSRQDILQKVRAAFFVAGCAVVLIAIGIAFPRPFGRLAPWGAFALAAAVGSGLFMERLMQMQVDAENARRHAGYETESDSRRRALEERRIQIVESRRRELAAQLHKSRWALEPAANDKERPSDPLSRFDVIEVAGAAGLSTAELLWSWARMDPDVIRAADFSLAGANLHGRLDFVSYITAHYDHLSLAAKQKSFDRLLGYVGEQRYYDLMVSHGHVVTSAATANQSLWDFVIDGHFTNVKTVADLSSVGTQHAGIIYAVPQDATGHLDPNMVRVPGLSHHDLATSLHHSIDAAHGGVAVGALAHHLPVIAIGRAALKGYAQVRAGQQARVAIRYGAIDVPTKTIGTVIFAKAGVVLGHAGGPAGMVLGFGVGAMVGAVGGAKLATAIKTAPLKAAETQLNRALSDYWQSTKLDGASILNAQLDTELQARRTVATAAHQRSDQTRSSLRWAYWPEMEDVSDVELAELAWTSMETCESETAPLRGVIWDSTMVGTEAEARREAAIVQLGVLLVNTPELVELVGADTSKLKAIATARSRLTKAREDLDPGTTPVATAKATIGRAKHEVPVLWYRTDWHKVAFYHDESAVVTQMTSSCPVLDAALKSLRDNESGKNTDQLNKRAATTWGAADGRITGKTCSRCEPLLVIKLKRVLAEGRSPRPGWRVDWDSRSWRCERHSKPEGCPECPTGWD